jgi:lysosomal acid lipase/cholesteryl ester hydrolase
MDEFAFYDIPDSINYILSTTMQPALSYIGFSQGTAQAFATLSIHPTLNEKVNVFIALAPAMSPAGLYNWIVDAFVKASPNVLFLAFGRKSILSSATMWQSILYPPIFVRIIDTSLTFLFNWTGRNISPHQKLAAYPHLYSFTSTKSVVHWFQIMRTKSFQMYDDDVAAPLQVASASKYYKVAKFPTRNIKTPVVLLYGGSDSLVDIKVMLRELPRHTVAQEVPHFEHLDFLWGNDVQTLVFPWVLDALEAYSDPQSNKGGKLLQLKALRPGTPGAIMPPSYSEDERFGYSEGSIAGGSDVPDSPIGVKSPSSRVPVSSSSPSPSILKKRARIQDPPSTPGRVSSAAVKRTDQYDGTSSSTNDMSPSQSSTNLAGGNRKRNDSISSTDSPAGEPKKPGFLSGGISVGMSRAVGGISKGVGDAFGESNGKKKRKT